jgi:hypothetical protein
LAKHFTKNSSSAVKCVFPSVNQRLGVKCLSSDWPENSDSPFTLVAWDLTRCHPKHSWKGCHTVQPFYFHLPVHLAMFPKEKIPRSKANHFSKATLYNKWFYVSILLIFTQNLWTLLKSRWLFPRFPDNSQSPWPALRAGTVGRAWDGFWETWILTLLPPLTRQ